MRANRRTDTRPEVSLRSLLHRRGLRFRKDHPILADGRRVRPDIVFTRARVAVFVDGCYWHSCPMHATRPKRNAEFWAAKLDGTVTRDHATNAALNAAGWTVVRVWEHVATSTAADRVRDVVIDNRSGEPSSNIVVVD